MRNLVVAHYAMSGQFNGNTTTRWLACARGERDSFLTSHVKQRIQRAAVENLTVLLPMDAPAQCCDPQFYREHLRNSLVLLCCDAPGGTAVVAAGVCVGEEMYANVLDPALRFRGRRDAFDAMLPVDANYLLMPVHVVTSLLVRDSVVTLDGLAGTAPAALCADPRLPRQLELLVGGVQAALQAGVQAATAGAPLQQAQLQALAVHKALLGVRDRRTDTTGDQARAEAVAQLLDAVTGAMQLQPGELERPLPKTGRAKLAEHKRKKATQAVDKLLQECAKNVRSSMHLLYSDYADLQQLHEMSLR